MGLDVYSCDRQDGGITWRAQLFLYRVGVVFAPTATLRRLGIAEHLLFRASGVQYYPGDVIDILLGHL